MISVKELCVSLNGKQILNNVSFSLMDGHNLVILGRSGSGKTVLIKTLLGIYSPESGEVIIDGMDVHHGDAKASSQLKKRFAMVFQNAALLDSFTIRQNVALPLYERGVRDNDEIQTRVVNALTTVGLAHTLDMYPAQLSGGMRKRVGIARALVYNPDYIIFDEPVSGLDPITASEVLYYISQINIDRDAELEAEQITLQNTVKNKSVTLITITHEISNLDQIGDQVLFLDNGNVIFSGSLRDLKKSNDEFINKYLA